MKCILSSLLVTVVVLVTGCVAITKDDSKISLLWTIGLTYSQTGPVDKESRAEIGIDVDEEFKKPLADYLIKLSEDKEEAQQSTENEKEEEETTVPSETAITEEENEITG